MGARSGMTGRSAGRSRQSRGFGLATTVQAWAAATLPSEQNGTDRPRSHA